MARQSKTKQSSSFFGKVMKFLLYFIVFLILLLVGLYFSAGFLIKTGVNAFLPKVTGTPSSIENVDLSLFKGQMILDGLKIGNPAGFAHPTVFELGHIMVDVDPMSVLSNKIIVRQVLIENTNATAEINSKGSINLTTLNDNVQNFIGASDKKQNTPVKTSNSKESSQKSVVVKDLKINNSGLNFGVAGQVVSLKLPNIHKTNIGEGDKKNSIGDTIALILSYFSKEYLSALANSGNELFKRGLSNVKELSQEGVEKLKQTGDALTGEFNKAKQNVTDMTKGLKGLFK